MGGNAPSGNAGARRKAIPVKTGRAESAKRRAMKPKPAIPEMPVAG